MEFIILVPIVYYPTAILVILLYALFQLSQMIMFFRITGIILLVAGIIIGVFSIIVTIVGVIVADYSIFFKVFTIPFHLFISYAYYISARYLLADLLYVKPESSEIFNNILYIIGSNFSFILFLGLTSIYWGFSNLYDGY
jgi:hypothetical protein